MRVGTNYKIGLIVLAMTMISSMKLGYKLSLCKRRITE